MNSFTFNGKSSADFGLYVSNKDIYSMPARDMTMVSVPGRDGDIIIDNGRYENIQVSYKVGFKDIKSKIKGIKAWLAQPGYFELKDTYQDGYYRMACFSSSLNVEELLNNIGTAVIKFSCKPFMYAESGKAAYTITASRLFKNNEPFSCYPKLTVYGDGTLTFTVNNQSFTVRDVVGSVVVDGEMMCVYSGNKLLNNKASFEEFPVFVPGDNTVVPGNNVSRITVVPRYRTL